jgi:LDH2 family malate/lactate/ureidoglycolate dehydrogenase
VAADLAREKGSGCTALKKANHIGRVGEYADWLAREKLIGILMVGAPWMTTTPYGGREGIFGTNPMAWGVPTSDGPLVLDFATSAVAAGKLMVARDADKPVPQGWVLNQEGHPTTNPNDLFDGGMLLPFGTYKGFGLNLMMEIIPVLLAGYASAFSEEYIPGNATVMIALSIEAFTPYERFVRLTDELKQRIKQVPAAPGFDEVLLPGELEARSQAQRQREGIPLADQTWNHLLEEAAAWGVTPPTLT